MTAKIKLNAASGGGSISIQAPSSSSNNRVISLPDIADGTLVTSQSTLDATKLSGALPAISGANLTGIEGGLQVADIYRMTSSHQGNVDPMQNWARVNTANHGYIVGISSPSSGLFTFPQTGIYKVTLYGKAFLLNTQTASQQCDFSIIYTADNGSNYTTAAIGLVNFGGGGYSNSLHTPATCSTVAMFDITDVSNQKVRFRFGAGQGHEYVAGSSSYNETYAIFEKLGDT